MPYLERNLYGFKGEDATGREAAEAQQSKAHRRQTVLDALRRFSDGATADEVAKSLGWHVLSVRPRMSELRKAGKIGPTGARRPHSRASLRR